MVKHVFDGRATAKAIGNIARQMPFIRTLALNDLANQAQRIQQHSIERTFTVRQSRYILNTIKRLPGQDFATKASPSARVRVDPERNQLAKFEDGGEKHAIQGKQYVAVPSREMRRTKRGLVPRKLYPSAFKPFVESGKTVKGAQRSFIIETKGGNRLLLQRTGKRTVKARYLFVPSVPIDDRLHMEDNARATARSAWPSAAASAWHRAMKTAR